MGNLYIVETIEEFGKESLRGYFDMIPSERRDENKGDSQWLRHI